MTDRDSTPRVWLCPEPVDMRMGIHSLAALVRGQGRPEETDGTQTFAFFSKDLATVRMLHMNTSGCTVTTLRVGSDASGTLLKRLADRHD